MVQSSILLTERGDVGASPTLGTKLVHLDFETFSLCDLKKSGSYVYSIHKTTKILTGSIKSDGGELTTWRGDDFPLELYVYAYDEGVIFTAHNDTFERDIYDNLLVRLYGFPPIRLDRWKCTAAKAAQYSLPRKLEMLGLALDSEHKKDMAGHRLMLKMSKARKITKNDMRTQHEDEEDFLALEDYNIGDVRSEESIDHIVPDLSEREARLKCSDMRLNRRGVKADIEYAEAAIAIDNEYKIRLAKQLALLTDGYATKPTQREKILQWVNANSKLNLGSLTAAVIKQILDVGGFDISDEVRQVLEIRRRGAKNTAAKYKTIMQTASPEDGRIRNMIMYYGASTGRVAGRGLQPQNLTKSTIDATPEAIREAIMTGSLDEVTKLGDVASVLSSGIRQALIADTGKKFYVADFNAIEPRVLYWLSGYEKGIKIFREGGDPYIPEACRIYRVTSDKVTKVMRNLGKVAVLGLGYLMGEATFIASAKGYGVTVAPELAKAAVHGYRQEHAVIIAHAKALEAAAMMALRNPNKRVRVSDRRLVHFVFQKEPFPVLKMFVPAGGFIAYPFPAIVQGEYGPQIEFSAMVKGKWVRERTYSGKLQENVCQRVARDVLLDALDRLEERGYTPVLHVHDEGISEVDEGFGSLAEYEEIMSQTPEWATAFGGLPLAVEGWEGYYYKK